MACTRREQLLLGVVVAPRQLVGDPVVVLVDAEHEHEEDAIAAIAYRAADGTWWRARRAARCPDMVAPMPLMTRLRSIRPRQRPGRFVDGRQPVPVPDHADLAQREGDEHADDVELDELGDLGVVDDDEAGRRGRRG
jgi:hypothetical protein